MPIETNERNVISIMMSTIFFIVHWSQNVVILKEFYTQTAPEVLILTNFHQNEDISI